MFRLQEKLKNVPTEYSENPIDMDKHLKEGRYQIKVNSFPSVIASLDNSFARCSGGKSTIKLINNAQSSNIKVKFVRVC